MGTEEATHAEYWGHVRAIAEEASAIRDEDERRTFVDESCDGSWWTIYTHAAREAVWHSDHTDEGWDAIVEIGAPDNYAMMFSAWAHECLRLDVGAAIEVEDDDNDEDGGAE